LFGTGPTRVWKRSGAAHKLSEPGQHRGILDVLGETGGEPFGATAFAAGIEHVVGQRAGNVLAAGLGHPDHALLRSAGFAAIGEVLAQVFDQHHAPATDADAGKLAGTDGFEQLGAAEPGDDRGVVDAHR
jgi:hypothetical protein